MSTQDTISGHQIDLSEGRHVFVADQDESFIVEFQNAEGKKTYLRVSKEAAEALRQLLAQKLVHDAAKQFIAMEMEIGLTRQSKLEWRVLKQDAVAEGSTGT